MKEKLVQSRPEGEEEAIQLVEITLIQWSCKWYHRQSQGCIGSQEVDDDQQ